MIERHLASKLSEEDLEKGRRLYTSYCQRCHGANGDDTGYPFIAPLSGLSLRLELPIVFFGTVRGSVTRLPLRMKP